MKIITHKEFTNDYMKGWEQCAAELSGYTKEDLRAKFNSDYPHNWKPSNLGAYYYSKGYLDRLLMAFNNYS